MSLEVYSRQSKAFQYDGYKINSEMREHINAEKSSSNVHKDRDTVNFSAEGRNMCYGFGVHDVKDRAKHTVVKPGIAPLFDTISRTLKTVREAVHPGRWTTHFVITKPSDLDKELFDWMEQAYRFAQSK